MSLLHEGGAGGHRELHLDHARDRDDVPLLHRVVADEVAPLRVRVGPAHRQLAHVVDHRHAHREHDPGVAIVKVGVVEGGAEPLVDLQTKADVEGFLTGAADPEIGFPGLRHLDASLFERARAKHLAEDRQGEFGANRLASRADDRGCGEPNRPPRRPAPDIGWILVIHLGHEWAPESKEN